MRRWRLHSKGARQKGVEKVNEGVEGCQVSRSEKMDVWKNGLSDRSSSTGPQQGRSRQSRLASRGDRDEDQKKPKVGHVLR